MKLNTTIKVCAAALALAATGMYAQNAPKKFGRELQFSKCGTTEYEAKLRKKNSGRTGKDGFEQWLAPKIAAEKTRRQMMRSGEATNTVVTIPVVVHVIHNGDAIGTNENISEGQIMSQFTVLNQDFRKMINTPGHNTNPVGADLEIEFCLAKQDPAGINTSGIIRYDLGDEDGWDMEEIEVLKTQTQWDPEKYLNIWIVNSMTSGFFQLAGYAQFPTDSGLDGLEEDGLPNTANTDGVVIAADCFGSSDVYPEGNYMPGKDLGRTASHEIGHFFGLRHIWGDDTDCNGNDYCDDTPVAANANSGCPGDNFDSCPDYPGFDMYQNYMDYSDDACMNIFTLDQKDRMMAVLANSPRRVSLTTSVGCTPGVIYDNDGTLHIQGLNSGTACESTINPQIILINSGNNAITTASIAYGVDTAAPSTFEWTGNLVSGQQVTIALPSVNAGFGSHNYNVSLVSVNGVADQAPGNDTKTQTFEVISAYDTTEVVVTIQTDEFGDEILWAIVDGNENPIATNINIEDFFNSDWLESDHLYVFNVPIQEDGCYTFGMFDLGGDGICCDFGNGYYKVETLDGTLIAEGGQFAQEDQKQFRIDSNLAVNTISNTNSSIMLFPNPASTTITVSVPQGLELPDSYVIYNSLGQTVDTGKIFKNTSAIDVAKFSTGIYFVRVSSSTTSKTIQFVKN